MSGDIPPYRLHQSLGYWLSVTARLQERRLDEKLRDIGLTRITWCILLGLANEGLTQPSELADFVGIDRTATSRALRQLEQAGLVSRSSGTGDRRTRNIALTDEGQEAVRIGTPYARANGKVMSDRLGEEEAETLRQLLRKLAEGEEAGLSHL
ncbi:transcriptional regulator, MarR family [Pseudooceanicola antarcticus]|uniref:Transcriptional regulator n=1 Tax=Pseudooceanicola antarcticus TaxID=1247613 RepID=A0A285J9Z4_9RHOB|nr:MarR family transcriptional regulator [Pseudooceanicola antarcticus]PJE30794.1 transcriptional regulator [Pseudooceanicola antarcticus]SNY57064.1 transcriptional regulator, MarR family [Pseudooceanicola antarcticus]